MIYTKHTFDSYKATSVKHAVWAEWQKDVSGCSETYKIFHICELWVHQPGEKNGRKHHWELVYHVLHLTVNCLYCISEFNHEKLQRGNFGLSMIFCFRTKYNIPPSAADF